MIRSSASTAPRQVASIVEMQMNPITEILSPNIVNDLGIARHREPRQAIRHQMVRRQECLSKFFLRLLIVAQRVIEHRPIVEPPGAPLAIIVRALENVAQFLFGCAFIEIRELLRCFPRPHCVFKTRLLSAAFEAGPAFFVYAADLVYVPNKIAKSGGAHERLETIMGKRQIGQRLREMINNSNCLCASSASCE